MMNNQMQSREEDKIFCAHIEDMAQQMQRDNVPYFTRFLDEREQSLAATALKKIQFPSDQIYFWTGFSAKEEQALGRRMLGLFPEYFALTEGMDTSVLEEQFPVAAVTVTYREQDNLTHRDILGSLMGLGIKRELIGEILTAENFAVIFCTQTAQKIILSDLERIGRAGIKKQQGIQRELPPMCRIEYRTGTVSSLRLDCIVALATNLSREKSAAVIEGGLVNLNFFEQTKISQEVRQGDILSLRGYGRFVLAQIGSQSKKGRLHVTLGKYI